MEGGESIALETAKEYIKEGTEVVIKHFPMGKKNRIEKAKEAYDFIEEKLKEGKNVSFLYSYVKAYGRKRLPC